MHAEGKRRSRDAKSRRILLPSSLPVERARREEKQGFSSPGVPGFRAAL
jgi:hypothetical protein